MELEVTIVSELPNSTPHDRTTGDPEFRPLSDDSSEEQRIVPELQVDNATIVKEPININGAAFQMERMHCVERPTRTNLCC